MSPPELLSERRRAKAAEKWRAFRDAAEVQSIAFPEDPEWNRRVRDIFSFSEFVSHTCICDPSLLADLLSSGDLARSIGQEAWLPAIRQRLGAVGDADALGRELRRIRRREMVRIAWRDLAGWSDLDQTMTELSAFADASLEVALGHLYEWQTRLFGLPVGENGRAQRLVVIGMGKLGAQELNFSSDIDLIFAYPENGTTIGAKNAITNEEFFVRLCRQYIRIMGAVESEGPLFRVDLRLRPYGDNGPLVMSFDGMEDYYQAQGREWERYAWIKARAVAGDREAGFRLLCLLRPFVYRRYLDYGAFESIRDMKQKIAREVTLKGMQDHIKLGPGGIREVEFFGQTFQLLRGGVLPSLQCRGIQAVLGRLARDGTIPSAVSDELIRAYRFLRNTEHRLQEYADQQTHQLPERPTDRERLAASMGFDEPAAFFRELDHHRRQVERYFSQILDLEGALAHGQAKGTDAEAAVDFSAVWLSPRGDGSDALLRGAGYEDPAEVARLLETLQQDPATRALSPVGRKRLDNVVPGLLSGAIRSARPTLVLGRLLDLIKTIQRRTAYLALLQENPHALTQLVTFAEASPWIISYLMHHPVLLDELLDPRTLYVPPDRRALQDDITRRFEQIDPDDLEYQMEALRVFKQANTLRVAAADIIGSLPLMRVSDHLSDIATVALEKVLALNWEHLTRRHGIPVCRLDGAPLVQGFAVIGYGKLGGLELGYTSDLDLVFLHAGSGGETRGGDRPLDNAQFFARLGQRIIHMLSAHTPAGVLYETDMRLRPSGASGPLVSHIDAWEAYQMEEAWTWEHQALVRARGICGDPALIKRFEAGRRRVLARPRLKPALQREVAQMRERLRKEHASRRGTDFNLKQDRGGMVDIEFLVQYIILQMAHRYPRLLRWTDNVRQIQALAGSGIIGDDMAHRLRMAYLTYRAQAHRLSLQEKPPVVPVERMKDLRRMVIRLWNRVMGEQ
jgi:[glutamine synthetase] adenylyltransferase / [glutamine synthetase]-adenylyl-L-tyrosine phosphorylase